MKKLIIMMLAVGFIALLSANMTFGQDLSAREIMKKNDQQRKADDERLELVMKLINKKGKERVRQVIQITKTDAEGNQKSLIRFLSPADVKGTGLLTIEHSDRDDDQWLYLPALKKVRRISASDQSDNFMGSDFAYEDMGTEEMGNYDYRLIKTEILDGVKCYVIEAVPNNDKEKKESGYSEREIWIDKDNFVGVQIKYYDKKGELLKIFKASDIRLIDGTNKWRAHRMEMENIKTSHKTVLLFDNFVINKGIEDKFFTQRYLERGK
ncbi:MAG: outer membrane lipoprotein-sorting protein [Candidatus Aminicenantia bacterium]